MEEEEPLSYCLGDGFDVVGPGQVLANVNPEEPKASDFIHCSPIDGDGATTGSFVLLKL